MTVPVRFLLLAGALLGCAGSQNPVAVVGPQANISSRNKQARDAQRGRWRVVRKRP